MKAKVLFLVLVLFCISYGRGRVRADTVRATVKAVAPIAEFDSVNYSSFGYVYFDSGSAICTLSNLGNVYFYNVSYDDSIGVINWSKFGNMVTVEISEIQLACSSSIDYGVIELKNWPAEIRPSETYDTYIPIGAPQTNCGINIRFNYGSSRVEIVFGGYETGGSGIPTMILEGVVVSFIKD